MRENSDADGLLLLQARIEQIESKARRKLRRLEKSNKAFLGSAELEPSREGAASLKLEPNMTRLQLPQSPADLVERLRFLHGERKKFPRPARRLSLTPEQRAEVLRKTDRRCHLCGGKITDKFAADHVLSHAAGGKHELANYLPSHGLCNRCRWFYSPEEFQWILRLGVWARKQIEDQKHQIGEDMLREYWNRPRKKKKLSRNGIEAGE